MARYINKVIRLLQVTRHCSITQRIGSEIQESNLTTRNRCLHAVYQRNQSILCHCHRLSSQMTSATAISTWNDWLSETEEVYSRLKAMAAKDGWIQIRNTNTDPKPSRYLFSRVVTDNGPVIHYALFIQKEEKKLCGVCQFGDEAQGPKGFAHGGASATMHDCIAGCLAEHTVSNMAVTASLKMNFKKPTPLRTTILMEGKVDQVQGNKIFMTSYLKSSDGATVYSDCTFLFINVESKVRAMEEQSKANL